MTDAEREMELHDSLDRAIRNAMVMRMSHDRLLQALRDMVAGEPGASLRAEFAIAYAEQWITSANST